MSILLSVLSLKQQRSCSEVELDEPAKVTEGFAVPPDPLLTTRQLMYSG